MQVTKQTKNEAKQPTPLNLPESCLACRTLNVASFPVKLTQLDGSVITVCHVARCVNCGYIKNYGMNKGIYKLNGKYADFKMQYWPELQKNGITPGAFIDAVCEAAKEKGRSIWLDARNGLKQAQPSANMRRVMQTWEGLVNGRRAF